MDPEERRRLHPQHMAARCEGRAKDRSEGLGSLSGTSIRKGPDAVEDSKQEAHEFRQPVLGSHQSSDRPDPCQLHHWRHRYRPTGLSKPECSEPAEGIGLPRALCGVGRSRDGSRRLQPDRTAGDGARRAREDNAGGLSNGHRFTPEDRRSAHRCPLEAVTKAQRQLAKAVNFGLLFGQGAAGLAKYAKTQYGVDMSIKQAEQYRQAFFDTYPGLRRWQRRTAELAEASHSIKTPSGRVRTFKRKRGKSYYTAFLNTPVQGGAAEVMLAALAALDRRLKGLDAKLVNVVHDEIVLEVAAEQASAAKTAVEEAMVEGMLSVFPRANCNGLVEAHSGCNWAEAKG